MVCPFYAWNGNCYFPPSNGDLGGVNGLTHRGNFPRCWNLRRLGPYLLTFACQDY